MNAPVAGSKMKAAETGCRAAFPSWLVIRAMVSSAFRTTRLNIVKFAAAYFVSGLNLARTTMDAASAMTTFSATVSTIISVRPSPVRVICAGALRPCSRPNSAPVARLNLITSPVAVDDTYPVVSSGERASRLPNPKDPEKV